MTDKLAEIKDDIEKLPYAARVRGNLEWLVEQLEQARAEIERLCSELARSDRGILFAGEEQGTMRQQIEILEDERSALCELCDKQQSEIERLRTVASAELECEREAHRATRQRLQSAQEIEQLSLDTYHQCRYLVPLLWHKMHQARQERDALRQQLHQAQEIASHNIGERNQLLAQRDDAYTEHVRLYQALGHRPDDAACEQCDEQWRPVDDMVTR